MAACLQDVCRLCGGEGAAGVDRRNPHVKEKYQEIILRALDVDVGQDDIAAHPPFICHTCLRKLNKWWSAAKLRKKQKINIRVPSFALHQCARCVTQQEEDNLPALCDRLNAVLVKHPSVLKWRGADMLKLIYLGSSGRPEVEIFVKNNLALQIVVCGVDVKESGSLVLQDLPVKANVADVEKVLETLDTCNTCTGNPGFSDLVKSREGPAGQLPISITTGDLVQMYPFVTIRHKRCHLLVPEPAVQCEVCLMFKVDLKVLASRVGCSRDITTSSSITNKVLSHTELQTKVKLLKVENKALKRKNVALHTKIAEMMKGEGVAVNSREEAFLQQALNEREEEFQSAVTDGSPAALLWEQQKKALQKGKGMRWHPAVIRFCIALQSKSSSSYNLLRESGFLKLPHPNTLHQYTHFGNPAPGFNSDLVLRIAKEIDLQSLPQHEREVCILFDEMKIKSSLVYSVRSGAVVGFVDVGCIGNEILQFEKRCKDGDVPIASHVMVLMIRGIFTSLRSPIGYFPSLSIASHQLYPCMWETVMLLEAVGFSVRAFVSDGASPNTKFYRMHGPRDGLVYSTPHPASPHKLYFFCDPPHLMKTTRNNWENSGYHNKTRNLHVSFLCF